MTHQATTRTCDRVATARVQEPALRPAELGSLEALVGCQL